MVKLTVRAGADLVANSGFKIDEDATGNVLSSTSLGEKGVERVVTAADSLVGGHLAIRLDAVLKAVKLPTGLMRYTVQFVNCKASLVMYMSGRT